MTRLLDGPARGKVLALKRAPLFLRVVVDKAGGVDALDQVGDVMRASEVAYAYRRDSQGRGFACGTGGCYPMAAYRLLPNQPEQEVMHSLASWQSWCLQQKVQG